MMLRETSTPVSDHYLGSAMSTVVGLALIRFFPTGAWAFGLGFLALQVTFYAGVYRGLARLPRIPWSYYWFNLAADVALTVSAWYRLGLGLGVVFLAGTAFSWFSVLTAFSADGGIKEEETE